MAKNEAKIRFTAETGEFNDQIKQSNAEMSKLRAEMKLNQEQMKTAGVSVEGLQQKQKLLEAQLATSRQKTEALSQKMQKAAEIYGENSEEVTKLQTQLITAQTAEERLTRQISSCNEQLESQRQAENRVLTETEKLTYEIGLQQAEVNKLKNEYKEAVLKFGATSDEAKELAGKIDTLSGELKENKRVMSDAESAADDLDKSLDNASDNDGEGFTVFKGALADLVSEGIQFAIGKVNELVDYMFGLPEATREIRQDFATLTTAFDNMGYSTETATETWKGLYGVFGEDDRAVETANNIARIAQNEEDLNKWVTITTGIWGTYQDSLPVEGLAEAADETAKVGTVTGGLADALNWSSEAAVMFADYMGGDVVTAEDAFNAALAECNTEQERQRLITDTLTKLYGGAAETYRETSGAMLEAKEATAENILAENNLATALEPVTTKWQEMRNELKTNLLPAAETLSDWALDALSWMQEHPKLITVIATTLGVFAGALTALSIGFGIYTVAQWAATSALWAFLAPLLPIIAAIAAVIAAIVAIIVYWDELKAIVVTVATAIWEALKTAWDWIVGLFSTVGTWIYDNVIAPVAEFFSGLWNGLVTGLQTAWTFITGVFSTVGTWIYENVIAPVLQFFADLWNGIVSAFHTVIDPWIEIIKRASALIYETVIQPIAQFFVDLWNSITSGLQAAWDWIVGIATTVAGWVNDNVVQPVVNFFVGLWDSIKNGVQTAIDTVRSVLGTISNWVNQKVVQPITQFFANLWSKFTEGATNAWNGVKSVFSKVASFFGDIFSKAWEKVKAVFSTGGKIFSGIKDGIVNAFKAVVNVIIKGINKVISIPLKGLNNVLNRISNIEILGVSPFSWLTWRAPIPEIPLLAQGGILTKPTLNIAGEAGPEAVIPIDKLKAYIREAIQSGDTEELVDAISNLANRNIQLNIDGKGWVGNMNDFIKELFNFDAHSNSMKNEVGRNLAENLAAGITENADKTESAAEKMAKNILDTAQKKLDDYKVYNELTLADEVAFWESVTHQVEQGTEARLNADKKYLEAKKKLDEQILKSEQTLQNELGAIQKKKDTRAEQLFDAGKLFGDAETPFEMMFATASQTKVLEDYGEVMSSLKQKLDGTTMWNYVKELSVSDLKTLNKLNSMTSDELDMYSNIVDKKMKVAKQLAEDELQEETLKETATAYATFNKSMSDLGVQLTDTTSAMETSVTQNFAQIDTQVATTVENIETCGSALKSLYENFKEFTKIGGVFSNVISSVVSAAPLSDKLQSYMGETIEKTMQNGNIASLLYAVEDLANRAIQLNINGQKFAVATAGDTDIVNGTRMQLSKRGLAR